MNLIRPKDAWSTSRQARGAAAILLIRHAETDLSGSRLCGRLAGIHLNDRGRAQSAALCTRLAHLAIGAVYSSPLERALETAAPIAAARRLDVVIDECLNEIDFGAWTGLTFSALQRRAAWRRYNTARAGARVPGGESPAESQRRIVMAIDAIAARHPRELVVAVTHAELIRYARLFAERRSVDYWNAIDVQTGSITAFGPMAVA